MRALREAWSGDGVMKEKFQMLLWRVSNPAAQIQVLPFSRGAHSAMNIPLVVLDMDPFGLARVRVDARIGSGAHRPGDRGKLPPAVPASEKSRALP